MQGRLRELQVRPLREQVRQVPLRPPRQGRLRLRLQGRRNDRLLLRLLLDRQRRLQLREIASINGLRRTFVESRTKSSRVLVGAALLCAASALGFQGDSEAARKAGLDPAKLSAIRVKMQEFVDQSQAAGIVTLVGRRGQLAHLDAVGFRDLESKDPMRPDTIFRIASMTKPVTAIGIQMLEEEGRLSIEDSVEKHLPEFKGQMLVKSKTPQETTLVKPSRPITIRDLLTHTSGLPGGPPIGLSDLYAKRHRTLAEAAIAYSQMPLQFEPGTKWSYCNAGIDTLGRIIEVLSGKSYEAFLDERLFKPLGMKDTFFYPTAERLKRAAKIYKKAATGLAPSENFIGDPIDGKFPLPAGGLYSTAADLAKLYQMMLNRGSLEGRRYLTEASVERMTKNHTGELRAGFTDGIVMGLGWQIVGMPTGVTEMLSPGAYGHGGAFGTQAWLDPKKEMYFVLLVQRSGFPNGDASDLRKSLQALAVAAITN
jgi:CubicO group peptidase (beta-lactamase class C family)